MGLCRDFEVDYLEVDGCSEPTYKFACCYASAFCLASETLKPKPSITTAAGMVLYRDFISDGYGSCFMFQNQVPYMGVSQN